MTTLKLTSTPAGAIEVIATSNPANIVKIIPVNNMEVVVKAIIANAPVIKVINQTATSDTIKIVPAMGPQGEPGPGFASGGTTGQILAKASNTDYDTVWTDQITQENIQDYVAPLFVHNNHTNASVTYEDALNELHIDVTNAPSAGYTSQIKHAVRLGEAIAKGQAVYVSSSNGTNMIVSKASNATEATSSKTMGLLEAGGNTNAQVNVITEGLLAGLDTSTATAGDPVWLGTAGNLIYGLANKPYAPAHLVFIGIVTRVNQNNGEIFIKVQNGLELRELHTVQLDADASITNNELLAYETATSLWKNKTFAELGLATSSYVDTSISNLVGGATAALDTLNELATALGNDASFATTVTNSLAGKASLSASNTFSGTQVFSNTVTQNGFWQSFSNMLTSGKFTVGSGTLVNNNQLAVINGSSTNIGLVVKGAASQTANLQEWQDSNANILTKVDSSGTITVQGTQTWYTQLQANNLVFYRNSTSYLANNVSGGLLVHSVTNASSADTHVWNSSINGFLINSAGHLAASTVPLRVRGSVSQSTNLQEWQDSTGTVLARVDSAGSVITPTLRAPSIRGGDWANAPSGTWATSSVSATASTIGLIVKAAASQTADLQQWQNSAGTTLTSITSGGALSLAGVANGSTPYMTLPGTVKLAYQGQKEINIRNLNQLRFENGDNWDYNMWGGLGFDSTTRNLYLGGPASTYFSSNAGAARVIMNLVGISTFNADARDTILQSRGTNTRLVVKGKTQTATITNASGSGTVVSYTTSSQHFFDAGDTVTITGVNPSAYNLTSVTVASVSSQTSFTVNNAATGTFVSGGTATVSQTTDLVQIQDNSANNLLTIRPNLAGNWTNDVLLANGPVQISPTASGTGYGLFVKPGATSSFGILVRAAASQVNDLQQWQNSAGSTLSRINNIGQMSFGTALTSTTLGINNDYLGATTVVNLAIRAAASQTADLTQWQNSAGSTLAKVDANGNFTMGANLTFTNPGIGSPTTFTFTKTNDNAWLKVTERASDATTYEFGMSDNPDGSDYFQWRWDDWQNAGTGWMPIQLTAFTNRFIGKSNNFFGNIQLPYNSGFYTYNHTANVNDVEVNKYLPTNSTTNQISKDAGTGTGTFTVDATNYTGTGGTAYYVVIDGAGTFKWGTGSYSGTATATGVVITGSAQTLSNGITVTLSLTGHAVNDRWSFRAYPPPQFAIGTGPYGNVTSTLQTKSNYIGHVIRGSASQTANLQEWQGSTGTILSKVDANGVATFSGTANGSVTIGQTGNNTPLMTLNGYNNSNDGSNAALRIINQNYSASTPQVALGGAVGALIQSMGTGSVSAIIKAVASQTADLQQWQTSTGTVLSNVDSNGHFILNSNQTATTFPMRIWSQGSATTPYGLAITRGGQSLQYIHIHESDGSKHVIETAAASAKPLYIRNNQLESLILGTNAIDRITINSVGTTTMQPDATAQGLIVKGAASQSANLQEWQDSAGNILKRLDNAANTYNSNRMFIGTNSYTANTLLVQAIGGTAEVTTVIRAKASQTGNLTEWQSSGGTALTYVDVSGNIWSPANTVPAQTSWTGAVSLTQAETINTYIPKLLTGNTTVTLPSGVSGKRYECHLELQQDATGSRTIILKGARTAYGVVLTLTTTANAIDIVRLEWNGTYWTAFMGAPQVSVPAAWV